MTWDGPPILGLDKGPITSHSRKPTCYKLLGRASELKVGPSEHGNEP